MSSSLSRELAGEVHVPARWRNRYARLRWLMVAAMLLAGLLAQFVLGVTVLVPVSLVVAGVACYDFGLRGWERRRLERCSGPADVVRSRKQMVLAQVVADLVALTVMLHYLGGIETLLFLFYFVHVGFASVMLGRADAFKVMGSAIGLFVGLAALELLGWVPHQHLSGFVPPGLHEEIAYVTALVLAFAVALVVLTTGLTAIMGLLRDRWGQRATERDDQLADLDRMRTFFLGLASHDLKTPLAVVSNYLRTILDGFVGTVDPRQRRWMERADLRILGLIRLIDDFVDVSQLAPDRILEEMTCINLGDTLDSSIHDMRHQLDEKDLTLQTDIPPDLPTVHASQRRVQRVLTNLLINAATCSPRHGVVIVEACVQTQVVRVSVVDAGPGIPSQFLTHVFDDYLQVQRAEFVPGAGLGLSTARRIVEAHGGTILVESPCFGDGKGCRFSFTLPLAKVVGDDPKGVTEEW
jgi:signal transduction histidine kinase